MIPEIMLTDSTPVPSGTRQARDGVYGSGQELFFGVLLSLLQFQYHGTTGISQQGDGQIGSPTTQHDVSLAQMCRVDSLEEGPAIETLSWASADEPEVIWPPVPRSTIREIKSPEQQDVQAFMLDRALDVPVDQPPPRFEIRTLADSERNVVLKTASKVHVIPDAECMVHVTGEPETSMKADLKMGADNGVSPVVVDDEASLRDGTDFLVQRLKEDWPTDPKAEGPGDPELHHLVPEQSNRLSSTEAPREFEAGVKSDLPSIDFTRAREVAATLYRESLKNLPKSLEFRLDPPELGKVTVLLTTRGDEVAVKFVVSTPGAGRVIAESTPDLSRALSEQGLLLAGTVVDNGSADSGPGPEERPFQRSAGRKAGAIRNVSEALTPLAFGIPRESGLDYLA
jgi:hypothetical protein